MSSKVNASTQTQFESSDESTESASERESTDLSTDSSTEPVFSRVWVKEELTDCDAVEGATGDEQLIVVRLGLDTEGVGGPDPLLTPDGVGNDPPSAVKKLDEETPPCDVEEEIEDHYERKRRLARSRQERWLMRQSQESLDRLRKENAERKRLRRMSVKAAQAQERRSKDAEAQQLRYNAEHLDRKAMAQRLRLMSKTPEQAREHRDADADADRLRLVSETSEQAQQRHNGKDEAKRRLMSKTPKEARERRNTDADAKLLRLVSETPEQARQRRRNRRAEAERLRRKSETPEQARARRDADAEAHRLCYPHITGMWRIARKRESQSIKDKGT